MKIRTAFSTLLATRGFLLAITTSAQPLTAEESITPSVQSDSTVRPEADIQPNLFQSLLVQCSATAKQEM